jgi:cation diffusion facilitator family transporter
VGKNTGDAVVHDLHKGETVSKYSSVTSTVISVAKGVTGYYTGSVALMADAVNSFSDIFASLAVFFGLKLSQKKATKKFPYGYYKAETLASLVVSVLIVVAGIEILWEAGHAVFNPGSIVMAPYALIVVFVSSVVYVIMARYKIKTGEEIESTALINDGKHSLVDTASSGLVFAGILLSYIGYPWLEAVAGIIVSALVIKVGVEQGRYAVLVLLDACLKPELIEKAQEIALDVQGVEGVHNVKIRRSGPFAFGEMHLETKSTLSVEEAHGISEEVTIAVKKAIPEIDSISVHIEPKKGPLTKGKIAVPVTDDKGLQSGISSHLGKAPYFVIATVKEGKIIKVDTIKNPGAKSEEKRGVKAVEALAEQEVDIVVTKSTGKGSQYALDAHRIQVKEPKGETLKEIIENAV